MKDEVATVLVTVKTYPSPSDQYGETVCVAGVRLDGPQPRWVRLYPMKYRATDADQQFQKYEIIEIPVRPHGGRDPRPESMRPDQGRMRSVRVVDTSRNWAERRLLLGSLLGATTTCELIAANRAVSYADAAPSLGLVRVSDISVTVASGEPWDPNQLRKAERAAMPDLFNPDGMRQLEPAPFQVRVRYRCSTPTCPGHEPKLLDWETGQAGRKWLQTNPRERVPQMLRDKYEQLLSPNNDVHLYVGNLHLHRTSFSALGVWSAKPTAADAYDGALF